MTYDQWKTRSPDDERYHRVGYDAPRCEQCDTTFHVAENEYGEFICENCEQNAAEAAWERHCEDFHDGGSTKFISLQQQQIEAQKLK